jgi:hypothetical protein
LNLPATALLPHAHQTLVRLASKMPFEQATSDLAAILGVQISSSTTRRQTLQAGCIAEEISTFQAQTHAGSSPFPIPREEPVERLAMGSDGGMVPLRKGVWAEVKTVVIAQVCSGMHEKKEAITTKHSYFSRLADAETFADLASAEIARRAVAEAKEVCAIQDGAPWLQGFVDGHRSDAVRILDFAHAAEYLGKVAQEGREAGYHVPACWLRVILHQLKHHGPKRVMAHLHWWEQHRCSSAVCDLAQAWWKVATKWSCKPDSRELVCIGKPPMSTRCSLYAMSSTMIGGRRVGPSSNSGGKSVTTPSGNSERNNDELVSCKSSKNSLYVGICSFLRSNRHLHPFNRKGVPRPKNVGGDTPFLAKLFLRRLQKNE